MENLENRVRNNKIQIRIPFTLKDNFKTVFKTAKWNSSDKVWEINNTKVSSAKLEKWIIEGSKVVKEIEAVEELDFSERELEALKSSIQKLRSNIDSIEKSKEKLLQINKEIETEKSTIELLKNKLSNEQSEKEKEYQKVKAFIDSIINVEKIISAQQIMCKYTGNFTTANRKLFEKAQDELYDIRETFRRSGFTIPDLDYLVSCNWNRPDRDNPKNAKNFYNIKKIQKENNEQ